MGTLSYFLIVLMGFVLGLLGGGGSILSVPILVYGFKLSAVQATSYSLFIVGSAALLGAFRNFQKKNVDVEAALTLALPGLLAVSFSRQVLIPLVPETVFSTGTFAVSKDNFILFCFAGLMLMASYSMLFGKRERPKELIERSLGFKVFLGFAIGIATGFVGAGGGFILVPVLVGILYLPIRKAAGTSLLVIAINSIVGFLGGSIGAFDQVDFPFLLFLSAIGCLGILAGIYCNQFVPAPKLKKGFGVFVFVFGIWLIFKQLS